jgi:hypothetical protein
MVFSNLVKNVELLVTNFQKSDHGAFAAVEKEKASMNK